MKSFSLFETISLSVSKFLFVSLSLSLSIYLSVSLPVFLSQTFISISVYSKVFTQCIQILSLST